MMLAYKRIHPVTELISHLLLCRAFDMQDQNNKRPDYSYTEEPRLLVYEENCVKPFKCNQCKFQTRYKRSLNRHFIMHENIRPFPCPKCIYRARFPQDLKFHIQYGCDKMSDLKNMWKTVDGEFQCKKCDYNTSNLTDYIRHKRCHTRERPFACDICEYRASRKCAVDVHRRIHFERERKYKCDHCEYKAYWKYNLSEHVKKYCKKADYCMN